MIELFLVALFQVAAGAPETPATPAPTEEQQPATSEQTQTDNQTATPPVEDRGLRCERVASTGSHLHHRICTTEAQRRAMRESVEHDLPRISRGSVPSRPLGGN